LKGFILFQSVIKQFYQDHRVPNPINITLTERQIVDGQHIDDTTSEANCKHFLNLLNRRLFGNAHKRYGRSLSTFMVREHGAWQRHHIHAIIEQPNTLTTEEFMALVLECWTKTKFGYYQIHFEQPADQDRSSGWVNYCLKKRTKADLASSIDWGNSTCFQRR
jgi:hypothetical protein